MKLFVTSDTHFNHANILTYENRPFRTVETMNEGMIRNWNEVVAQEDTVLHLGDFAFNTGWDKFPRLNGNIRFIRGNHDYEKKYKPFLEPYTKIDLDKQMWPYLFIDYHLPDLTKKKLLFCHYPVWAADHHDHANREIKELMGAQNFFKVYELYQKCDLFLYGHTHGKAEPNRPPKAVRVCVEDWDYRPVELIKIVQEKFSNEVKG